MIQNQFHLEFELLLKGSMPQKIAIAVSGGVDSVALSYLVSSFAKDKNIQVYIFSVNHNLRAEASEEISYVSDLSKKLGAEFFALSWDCGGNKTALQERARSGRYDLMTKKCHEFGIDILLTAHHLDDMIETYLMRKEKKSGIFGLSSSCSFFHNNVRILRPLHHFPKAELIKYLEGQNIKWFEDKSNKSDLYERNRVRKKLAALSDFDKDIVIDEIRQVNERASGLNERLIQTMAESLEINNYGFATLDLDNIKNESNDGYWDIKIQILNYILTIIGGKTNIPRFRNLENLLDKLQINNDFKCSLHGCIIKKKNNKLWIFREKSAIKLKKIKLNLSQYWDNRFQVTVNKNDAEYYIEPLNMLEYIDIRDKIDLNELEQISDNNHKLILFTLPVIKKLEKIVAIPHISYYDVFDLNAINIVFRPNFISRFTHFL